MSHQPALRRSASMAEAGRPCPYCRFPLKEGGGIVACGACSAIHHDDCWQENRGCAVLGCAGAQEMTAMYQTAAAPQPGAYPNATVTQWVAPPPPPPGSAVAPTTFQPAPPAFTPPPPPAFTPPPQRDVALASGATVKVRHPLAVLALHVVTLGWYGLYWWYQVNRELRDYGRAYGVPRLGDSPGLSLVAYAFGGFLLAIPVIGTIIGTSARIRRAQQAAGVPSFDPVVATLLWIFTLGVGGVLYTQAQANKVWRHAAGDARVGAGDARTAWLAAAVVVLAVALIGTVATVLVTRDDTVDASSTELVPTDEEVPSDLEDIETTTEPEPEFTPEPEPVDVNGLLPDVGRRAMRGDIELMLTDWHWAVVEGDYRGAWDMMTARKQRQKRQEEGFGAWSQAQASLAPYLDPSGLRVRILDMSPTNGVATVRVTGMGWSKPGSACTTWSGITWVKYEGGQWRYDPGYSTTPSREHAWEARYDELMGVGC